MIGALDGLSLCWTPVATLSPEAEQELTDLVARAMPGVPALAGRWYWDVRPDVVVVARIGLRLVGLRTVVFKDVEAGARRFRVAGLGIAVDPRHRHRGIGTALTSLTLDMLQGARIPCGARSLDPVDAAVVVLASDRARGLLTRAGFLPLLTPVWSRDRDGADVEEIMPVWSRDVRDSGFRSAVVAAGRLHLGTGTF